MCVSLLIIIRVLFKRPETQAPRPETLFLICATTADRGRAPARERGEGDGAVQKNASHTVSLILNTLHSLRLKR